MGANQSTHQSSASNQKKSITSLMEMFKPACMGQNNKMKKKKKNNKYKKMKAGFSRPTLEDWLHYSPSHHQTRKQSPSRVCPDSLAVSSHVFKGFSCTTSPRDSISINGSFKKRVSFRLPEEADIHFYNVHDDDDDDDDEHDHEFSSIKVESFLSYMGAVEAC